MKRREFIFSMLGSAAVASLPLSLLAFNSENEEELVLLCNPDPALKKNALLKFYSWRGKFHRELEIPLQVPHALIQNKKDPNEAFIFEQMGSAVKLNLKTQKIVLEDHTKSETLFYGHAAQADNGLLLCTEKFPYLVPKLGHISIRDPKTFKEVDRIAGDLCQASHDLALLRGDVVAIANHFLPMGEKTLAANVSFVNWKQKKLIKKIELTNKEALGHIAVAANDTVMATVLRFTEKKDKAGAVELLRDLEKNRAGYSRLYNEYTTHYLSYSSAPVLIADQSGRREDLYDPRDTTDFHLNFGLGYSKKFNIHVTTHARSNRLRFWKENKVIKAHEMVTPLGLTIDKTGEFCAVVEAGKGNLLIFSLANQSLYKKIEGVFVLNHPGTCFNG